MIGQVLGPHGPLVCYLCGAPVHLPPGEGEPGICVGCMISVLDRDVKIVVNDITHSVKDEWGRV